jgi:hypothetical protein
MGKEERNFEDLQNDPEGLQASGESSELSQFIRAVPKNPQSMAEKLLNMLNPEEVGAALDAVGWNIQAEINLLVSIAQDSPSHQARLQARDRIRALIMDSLRLGGHMAEITSRIETDDKGQIESVSMTRVVSSMNPSEQLLKAKQTDPGQPEPLLPSLDADKVDEDTPQQPEQAEQTEQGEPEDGTDSPSGSGPPARDAATGTDGTAAAPAEPAAAPAAADGSGGPGTDEPGGSDQRHPAPGVQSEPRPEGDAGPGGEGGGAGQASGRSGLALGDRAEVRDARPPRRE